MDTFPDIPGYEVEERIGSGAMATVYRATQTSLQRPVALKIMAASLVADASFCARFLKEGRIIAKLIHPNIVTIYDIGVVECCYYMAMEYVSGNTLIERIRDGLDERQAVAIICQVAASLGYAHRQGFVHRDVKPANILFRQDGTSILSDFGIAKALGSATQMTAAGWTVGTPNYMSPEQALGKPLDARCDLYSLGIVLFEMLAGEKPYQSPDPFATALMHVNSPLPRLPNHLAAYQGIIDKLLAKDRDERFASAEELIDAIEPISAERSAPAIAERTRVAWPMQRPQAPRPPQRNQFITWLFGGVLTGLVGAGIYVMSPFGSDSGHPQRPATVTQQPATSDIAPSSKTQIDPATLEEVHKLLEVASAHEGVGRLTDPPGSNAAHVYRRVLDLDPENVEATAGLKSIAALYTEQARASLAENAPLAESLQLVESGLNALPNDIALRALKARIQEQMKAAPR